MKATSRDPGASSHRGVVRTVKILAALAGTALIVWMFIKAPLAGLLLVGILLMLPQLVRTRSEG